MTRKVQWQGPSFASRSTAWRCMNPRTEVLLQSGRRRVPGNQLQAGLSPKFADIRLLRWLFQTLGNLIFRLLAGTLPKRAMSEPCPLPKNCEGDVHSMGKVIGKS